MQQEDVDQQRAGSKARKDKAGGSEMRREQYTIAMGIRVLKTSGKKGELVERGRG